MLDHAHVAVQQERVVGIEHVSDAAAHAGSEVATRGAEDHNSAARHVLAAMVADAFDYGVGPAVADSETFGGPPAEEGFAASRTIKRDIADDDVVFSDKA